MSDVLCLSSDEYAVCGSRLVKMGCTLSQNGIGNGSNAQELRRSVVVQVLFWTFRVSGSAKCVTQRGVGLLGRDAAGVMLHVILFPTTLPWVRWGDRLLSRVVLVLQLGAQDLDTFHHGTKEMVMCPLRAGVGPSPGGNESGKKGRSW